MCKTYNNEGNNPLSTTLTSVMENIKQRAFYTFKNNKHLPVTAAFAEIPPAFRRRLSVKILGPGGLLSESAQHMAKASRTLGKQE